MDYHSGSIILHIRLLMEVVNICDIFRRLGLREAKAWVFRFVDFVGSWCTSDHGLG